MQLIKDRLRFPCPDLVEKLSKVGSRIGALFKNKNDGRLIV